MRLAGSPGMTNETTLKPAVTITAIAFLAVTVLALIALSLG